MGMFNDIQADLVCPVNGKPTLGVIVQIKWQDRNSLYLRVYKVGEKLEDILSRYDNRWVRVFYGCPACRKHTTSEDSAVYRGLCDMIVIYDNSTTEPRLVATIAGSKTTVVRQDMFQTMLNIEYEAQYEDKE